MSNTIEENQIEQQKTTRRDINVQFLVPNVACTVARSIIIT